MITKSNQTGAGRIQKLPVHPGHQGRRKQAGGNHGERNKASGTSVPISGPDDKQYQQSKEVKQVSTHKHSIGADSARSKCGVSRKYGTLAL